MIEEENSAGTEEAPPAKTLIATFRDYLVPAAKVGIVAVAAAVNPDSALFLAPLVGELIGNIVPRQRVDRVAAFAEALDRKLAHFEKDFVMAQLANENFTDLLEEGVIQAARATDQRREHIANLIANSLSPGEIEFIESKHLLRMLGEINDIEVIWLRFYTRGAYGAEGEDQAKSQANLAEFNQKHAALLEWVSPDYESPQIIRDKASLQRSYYNHLTRLLLLEPVRSPEGNYRNFDADKTLGYMGTPLGGLLLRRILQAPDGNK